MQALGGGLLVQREPVPRPDAALADALRADGPNLLPGACPLALPLALPLPLLFYLLFYDRTLMVL